MLRLFSCVLILSAISLSAGAQTIIDRPPKNIQIIVWAGQSNGVGQAPMGADNIVGDPHEYLLTLGGKWTTPAFEPSHTTETAYGGSLYPNVWPTTNHRSSGALVAFLHRWRQLNPQTNIAAVNISVGGTGISDHLPPGPIYTAGLAMVKKMTAYGKVAAIVWTQGENDTRLRADALSYLDRLKTLISAWRAQLGAQVPFVIVQLGDNPDPVGRKFWDIVKLQQSRAAMQIANVAVVQTGGLRKQDDGLHYVAESYNTFGDAAALALYSITH